MSGDEIQQMRNDIFSLYLHIFRTRGDDKQTQKYSQRQKSCIKFRYKSIIFHAEILTL